MTEAHLPPGWYPDADDPNARRYWDGQAWSAPLPTGSPDAPAAPLATAQGAPAPPTCAVAPCQLPRVPGSDFCPNHGMRSDPRAAPAGQGAASALVCPHCQTRGRVTSRQVKQKKGISGGKLTGAVLTGGISMLGTGLSRKEKVTEMKCGKCKTVWHV